MVEPRDIDIGAARLVNAGVPSRLQSLYASRERRTVHCDKFDVTCLECFTQPGEGCAPPRAAGDMESAARAEKASFGKIAGRIGEKFARCAGQRLDAGAAIGFGPEGRRTSGRVISGLRLALD